MLKDIIVIGAGGFAREIIWLIERINRQMPTWNILGYVDASNQYQNMYINGHKVLGSDEYLKQYSKEVFVVCALGSPALRERVVNNITKNQNIKFATLIDPTVILSERISIGEGSIICAGTIITVDIEIGNHVIINLDCTVGHDVIINNFVTVHPGVNISGDVLIKGRVEIGTGTRIIQGKKITKNVLIGAGTVIAKNIDESGTYVGVPAKKIK